MLLLLVGIATILALQRPLMHDAAFWDATGGRRSMARLLAIVSLCLWVAIIVAGRWIAYPIRATTGRPIWLVDTRVAHNGSAATIRLSLRISGGCENSLDYNTFTVVETIPIIAITMVVGTISIVDLRLLGFAWKGRTISTLTREILPVTGSALSLLRSEAR